MTGFHDISEEVLERVWNLAELSRATVRTLLDDLGEVSDRADAEAQLDTLVGRGLLRRDGEWLFLTAEGERIARHVVRAHRLAERLLTDVLELPLDVIEGHACRLEHAISAELADDLCTLLGHPPTSPDGKPIPPGSCCSARKRQASPAIVPLTELAVGRTGRIILVHPTRAGRLDQLSVFGIVPGTELRVSQRSPALVVEIGETTLALDPEVGRDILVKPVEARRRAA